MKEGFNIKSSLKIEFDSKREIDTIISVLTPDNVRIPEGLKIDIRSENNYLIIDIQCENGSGTFLNIIDELLEHISLSRTVTSND
ncbi:MAG TPA: KEOPS complex subunit Pcc1 [Nitrososphaeraceae archaeon]|nr:KEOPS complex subunit Pcc1 [Nitrososphaeraceae archaeon]